MRAVYMLALSTLVSGCNGGIDAVSLDDTTPGNLAVGKDLSFTVTGKGKCGQFSVDWGDGTAFQENDYDFAAPYHISHRYDGWGGGKTVTVTPVVNCSGYARTRFKIEPTGLIRIGWARNENDPVAMCDALPAAPAPLAPHSLLHVMGTPSPVFNFCQGCVIGCDGCMNDPDGHLGSVAMAPFPFPGMREYSLVIKVPAVGHVQLFQGGKNENITVPLGGPIQVCMNTDKPESAVGGWEIDYAVDQLGP